MCIRDRQYKDKLDTAQTSEDTNKNQQEDNTDDKGDETKVTAGAIIEGNVIQDLSLIHISEPTRRTPISYAVFCLKKKKYKK